MSAGLFSSNEAESVGRGLEVVIHKKTEKLDVADFGIEETLLFITEGGYKRLALQFPDELLPVSTDVVAALHARLRQTSGGAAPTTAADVSGGKYEGVALRAHVFVLADTSFGACCVDEVAAEHLSADAIVHYGRTCLSPTSRLPVYYVFPRRALDVDDCIAQARQALPPEQRVIAFYEVDYHHARASLASALAAVMPHVTLAELDLGSTTTTTTTEDDTRQRIGGRFFNIAPGTALKDYHVLFIGAEGPTLSNLFMNFTQSKVYSYDPSLKRFRQENFNVNRALMKRYSLIERIKEASIIGIVVGTLSVARYTAVIERLRRIITAAKRKFYTFAVGKVNVPKLANYSEVDVFILVACPENTLVDNRDFYKPLATPLEAELALVAGHEWTGAYSTEFSYMLKMGGANEEIVPQRVVSQSLYTQRMVNFGSDDDEDDDSEGLSRPDGSIVPAAGQQMVVRQETAASRLAKRAYQGLNPAVGDVPASRAEPGLSGLARHYTNETTLLQQTAAAAAAEENSQAGGNAAEGSAGATSAEAS